MRGSPDHGTAENIIKKNKADSKSLEKCIKFILKKNKCRHKKSLGQNFLIDSNIIKKITSITKIAGKNILEIGPGSGNLTEQIIKQKPKSMILIEKTKISKSFKIKI